MRPGQNQTGYGLFAGVYMKSGRTAWRPVSGRNDMFCLLKNMADPRAYRLEISGPGLRFVVIYMRTVRTQAGKRISRLGPATETKSDRS